LDLELQLGHTKQAIHCSPDTPSKPSTRTHQVIIISLVSQPVNLFTLPFTVTHITTDPCIILHLPILDTHRQKWTPYLCRSRPSVTHKEAKHPKQHHCVPCYNSDSIIKQHHILYNPLAQSLFQYMDLKHTGNNLPYLLIWTTTNKHHASMSHTNKRLAAAPPY